MRYLSLFRFLPALLLALLLSPVSASAAPESVPLKTGWLGEYEAFPVWYARQQGWDKEAGLDVEMLRFDSGKALIEGMKAYKWVLGGCGIVPTVSAAFGAPFEVVGVPGDEAAANAVLLRKDGTTAVKGKLVLCTKGTSAHYTLVQWLHSLGLTEKDVKIRFMPPEQALGAFRGGMGDVLVTWAPYTYAAEKEGCVVAATAAGVKSSLPLVLLADKQFAAENAELVQRFLALYQRGAAVLAAEPDEQVVTAYVRFCKEWAGRELDAATARKDLQNHRIYQVSEQLELMGEGTGSLRARLSDMAAFLAAGKAGDGGKAAELPAIRADYLQTLPQ